MDMDGQLTKLMFQRSGASAAFGVLGAGIVIESHYSSYAWQTYAGWAVAMVVVFVARMLLARHALRIIDAGKSAYPLTNVEAALCALCGVGWGSIGFVFDNAAMDSLFYLRLMILAAALSFVLSSMTVYLRAFLAYVLTLFAVLMAYLLSDHFAQTPHDLVTCGVFYIAIIVVVAVVNNRRVREDVANQLAVRKLTTELTVALATERDLRADLSRLAVTDELTGVMNRRGVLECLEREVSRCRRYGGTLVVLMVDIDFFKSINDAFGHAGGDLALRCVVQSMQTGLRLTDVIGRFGGEEFLVILPSLDSEGGLAGAERIRRCVESAGLQLAGQAVRITVSIGVAVYRESDHVDSLIARADTALYAAKSSGRNQAQMVIA